MKQARIIGVGSYLPEKIVTNHDLAKTMDTSHDWIIQRTGIAQRHVAALEQTTSDLAFRAAQKAMAHANLTPDQLDGIIIATTTPDRTFPATAVTVQNLLGMRMGTMAFDVQAGCSGFIYALAVANNFIATGQMQRVLVIGAETMTRILDWNDRGTAILFGDGAGAVVLETSHDTSGILSTHLHADGSQQKLLQTTGGPSYNGQAGTIFMEGREVFRHAVQRLAEVVDETLAHNNMDKSDITWLVPHQANKRIIDATAEKLGLSTDQVILTVAQHGNTSAASVPLALAHGVEANLFKKDDILLLEAMGAGLTWGAALVRW
jgi:3-oxoacyl-[acyl-carrier-protein] synthase-3